MDERGGTTGELHVTTPTPPPEGGYPPPPPQGQPYYPPLQPPPQKLKWPLVVFVLVVGVVAIGIASGDPSPSSTSSSAVPSVGVPDVTDRDANRDVKISKCSLDNEYGVAMTQATVRITNNTERTQSYMATISVNDSTGTRIGEVNVVANSLAAGQSVNLESPGTASSGATPGQLVCTVANVSRFPS
jgi:hypothetical protein